MTRGRYAPSPTGFLHLGNARTALAAWLHTRSQGGEFVLRVEDLDSQRSKSEFIKANLEELHWLGLDWDEGPDVGGRYAPYVQSQRFELYQGALESLYNQGYLFDCYLSRKDLQDMASAPHDSMMAYGEKERQLNLQLREEKKREGKTPSLRFRVPEKRVDLEDAILGHHIFRTLHDLGDFVVKRADGEWAYQLAVVVDDIAMNITEVVRGEDLLQSTAVQLLLYEAFGVTPPTFAHVPLLLDETGSRMSKRRGSLTLSVLRDEGVKPERLIGLLAFSLGFLKEPEAITPNDLVRYYHLEAYKASHTQINANHWAWLEAN
ncbi:MAG: tRNA glutamyl-Q(34) synthetase GluQRS [Trueperaceae bacterium]